MRAFSGTEISEGHAQKVEREFQAVLDAVVDAVVIIDQDGTIDLLSHAGERMFGYQEEEVIGQRIDAFLPEPYRSEHRRSVESYLEAGDSRLMGIGREVLAQRRDGSVFHAEFAIGPVKDLQPPHFVALIRDITVRKRAEEALRRSESQLKIAQELANLGNYVVQLDGQGEDYWSAQLYRILGRKFGEPVLTLEQYLNALVHPADRARVARAHGELNDGDRSSLDIEYRVIRQDATVRHIHHIAQTLYDENGRRLRHVGTMHDITDRRRADDEMRQMQERLTHFGRISTMGEMAAGLAHEVNQPLTAIATYAQACQRLIASGEFDRQEIANALEQIGNQALRAGEVIRRLRSFVKNREVRREPIEANRLLADVLTLAQTDARHHNVRIRVELSAHSPVVDADTVQIQQVILNLLRNSIDAMLDVAEHARELTLRTRIDDEGSVEFMVADRGVGFDESIASVLFDPFFTTKPGGTGLGLPISRSIVRAHGGRLWCAANPGGGARFYFSLPVSPASSESA